MSNVAVLASHRTTVSSSTRRAYTSTSQQLALSALESTFSAVAKGIRFATSVQRSDNIIKECVCLWSPRPTIPLASRGIPLVDAKLDQVWKQFKGCAPSGIDFAAQQHSMMRSNLGRHGATDHDGPHDHGI